MSSNNIFDKASAQFERGFDAKLWIKRDSSHFIQQQQKKKQSRKSDTWKQLKSCSKHDIPHLSYGDGLYPTMTNW